MQLLVRTAAGYAENKAGCFTWRAVHGGIIGIKKHAVHKIHPSILGSSQTISFTIQYIYNFLYIELYGKESQMTTNNLDIEVFHIYYAAGGMI